jgi:hypothetical protein
MKIKLSPPLTIFFLLLALLLTIACGTNAGNTSNNADLAATQESLSQTQIALSVQQTIQAQSAAATPVPSAEAGGNNPTSIPPVDEPASNCKQISFQGIEFCYDPFLASDVSTAIAEPIVSEMDESFNLPKRYTFNLLDYALTPTFHEPLIQVFSVQEYSSAGSSAQEIIQDVQTLLQNKPEHQDSMPFLPQWNAAQMIVANVEYLTFENGQGVRYLTQYGQSYWPITNETLFYTFQGITNDGQYYISAILPVSHPDLPANGDAYEGDIDELGNNFEAYIENMRTMLYSQPDESFSPSLVTLDSMMSSFSIQP